MPLIMGSCPKFTTVTNQVKLAKDNLRRCELAKGQLGSMSNTPSTTNCSLTRVIDTNGHQIVHSIQSTRTIAY